jgi:hypothetical protein
MAPSCECGNETSGSAKAGDHVASCIKAFNEDSVPWSFCMFKMIGI